MDIKTLFSENFKWVHGMLRNNGDFYDGTYHSFGVKIITNEMYARANWKPSTMRGYDSGYVCFKTEPREVRITLDVFNDTDFEEMVDFQLNESETNEFFVELAKQCSQAKQEDHSLYLKTIDLHARNKVDNHEEDHRPVPDIVAAGLEKLPEILLGKLQDK